MKTDDGNRSATNAANDATNPEPLVPMSSRRHTTPASDSIAEVPSFHWAAQSEILPEEPFMRMLSLERKRSGRSHKVSILMLLHLGNHGEAVHQKNLEKLLRALSASTRESDITGWYRGGSVIGIIFTELGCADKTAASMALLIKMRGALAAVLGVGHEIETSLHILSGALDQDVPEWSTGASPIAEQGSQRNRKKNLHPA